MGKQRRLEEITAQRRRGVYPGPELGESNDKIVRIFEDNLRIASKTLPSDQAAAHAHDAVQRHLISSGQGRAAEAWAMQGRES